MYVFSNIKFTINHVPSCLFFQYNGNKRVYGPNSLLNSAEGNHTCSRRHLKVTFKELGWSDWIVAPLYFDVDYCAGSCSLPIPQVSAPGKLKY